MAHKRFQSLNPLRHDGDWIMRDYGAKSAKSNPFMDVRAVKLHSRIASSVLRSCLLVAKWFQKWGINSIQLTVKYALGGSERS